MMRYRGRRKSPKKQKDLLRATFREKSIPQGLLLSRVKLVLTTKEIF